MELALATLIADLKGASASVLAVPSFGAEPRSLGDDERVTEARFYVVVLLGGRAEIFEARIHVSTTGAQWSERWSSEP